MSETRDRLFQVLAELELCSHVPALDYAAKRENKGNVNEELSPGGKRPPGGIDHKEDHHRTERGETDARVLRSAQEYRQQLRRGRPEGYVLADAELSLVAWRKTPAPKQGDRPLKDSPMWKRYVFESTEKANDLAWHYGVDRAYIERIRKSFDVAA